MAEEPPTRFAHAGPGVGLVASRSSGLVGGLIFALVGGLIFGLGVGLVCGLVVGLIGGLVGGLDAWLYHHWLRWRLSARGVLPTQLPAFLPEAVRAYRDALEHADRTPATIAKHLSAIRGLAAAVGAHADVRTVRSASVARGEPRALSHEGGGFAELFIPSALGEGKVAPASIVAVSFTRASTMDLQKRIEQARVDRSLTEGDPVRVSTLHSLALRTLRRAGALEAYPADPTVLGQWELRNIFEAEFGKTIGIRGVTRPEQIRRDHEAFWQTGEFDPPNVIPPDPPISDDEREKFNRFHGPRTQLYSCVLPGEVIARCVERMEAGTLDPAELLAIEHLIVDEFQDLNPMDLRFVHGLAERGVRLFVAGDDDQSLYAFRYASPQGIELFTRERPGSGDHTLHHCFRCAPRVLDAAQTLIRRYAANGRIEKNLVSLWADADPPVSGALGCWSFLSGRAEARAIAQSCKRLIGAGREPSQIMILLASKTTPGRDIEAALDELEVPYAPVDEESVTDTEDGRVGYALLSVVVEPMNYVAHRSLFGLRQGVGLGTCNDLARAVISNNRNYRDLFYSRVPDGLVAPRAKTAIAQTANVCAELAGWSKDEALSDRVDDVCRLVDEIRAEQGAAEDLRVVLKQLPAEMTIEEAHLFLSASKDDDRVRVLTAMAARLEQPEPDTSLIPERVQVMTMHGVKGLSAKVVFIPGLEDASLPGEKRRAYPGLVLVVHPAPE